MLALCALGLSFGLPVRPAAGQVAPYKIAEAELAIDGLSAEAEGTTPVVPKNLASGLRVIVRAGGQVLSTEEAAAFLGPGFEVRAELAGPGLRQSLSLPRPGGPPPDDPFLLHFPGLTVAGDYTISGLRIGQGTRTLLDVAPRQVTLRVIEQVLVTSVQTRPLSMAELQDKGVLVDHESYLGFEFTISLLLESRPIAVTLPVVFNRQGVPLPPTIPLPAPIQRERAPLIVPVLFQQAPDSDAPPGGDDQGGGGGWGGSGPGGPSTPSILVIPGNVGYLKQHFSAQLFVANGAPAGSNLTVRGVAGTIQLPPGADAVLGTDDDPLVLAPLVDRPPTLVLPVRGVGPDGEPGTADDVDVIGPGALGQAEFLLRAEREGFHNIAFDIGAVLEGLPTGRVDLTGRARGAVLVRNALFDMAFTVPNVVRAGERFKLVATVSNVGRGDAHDLSVTIDQSRMSGMRLLGEGTLRVPYLAPGDAANVSFEFESQRTGHVVASYLHLDTGGSGRLNFTVGIGERGVPLSPDTLVLPTSVEGLPPGVLAAAMRVLGQAWSLANAPPERLASTVLRVPAQEVKRKLVALAEAGLRIELGQPQADAVRDLAFDFYGGSPLEPGFDQLLRQTAAGRSLALAFGAALAGAVTTAGSPATYERAASEIAAAGADFVAVSVRGTGGPVGVVLSDAAGRQTVLGRSAADVPLSQVPGAALLPLGAPASAPTLGLVTAPTLAPYTLKASGAAELSVTFPRGDGTFQHGTVITTHPARIVMDFASPHTVAVDEDGDGDGTYETRRDLVRDTLASAGPRLISAHVVGPETVAGASLYGVHAALLFDRMVGEEGAAEKGRYQVGANEALSAKRQLSGRLVFLGLAQPEGNYVPATVSVSGLPDSRGVMGPAGSVPLSSRLRAIGAVVSGRVVNADGTPFVEGLVFYSQYATGHRCDWAGYLMKVVAAVRPDADGRYEFRYVPRDPCGVPFEMAVYDPVTGGKRAVQLYVRTAGEQMVADLALMGRGTVAGTARTAAGDAVGGARVVAYSVTDSLVSGHATTGGDGRYAIPNITVGGVNVRAVQGVLVGQAAGRIERAGGTATVNVRLEGGSARLSGRVFKLEDGESKPLPGAYVQYRLSSDLSSTLLGVAQTDPAGRYVLEGMPAGNFRLSVSLNTRDRADVTGHADEGQVLADLDLVVVIPPESELGSVRGTVRFKDGRAAAGVLVNVLSRGTLSAADGSYAITGLAVPSNPGLLARTRDGLRVGTAHAFLTASNPHPLGIDITLSGDGNAEFTVLDPAGLPLAGQTVTLDGSCGNACGCATRVSDGLGRVRFEGLRSGASPIARAVRFADGVQDATQARVTVVDGQTAYGVLRFGGAGLVRGVVREEGTANLIQGAVVRLQSNRFVRDEATCGLVPRLGPEMRTDAQGRFEFPGVNAGPATAFAVQELYGSAGVGSATGTVAHGQELALQVSLRNTMAGGLAGTVFDPDGVTPAGSGITVTVNGMVPEVTVSTDPSGHYEFAEVLPQGHYTLTVRDTPTGRLARQRIYLRAQQDAVHDVRLLGVGTVAITVADGADEVVESATVQLRQTEYPFRAYSGVVHAANQGVVRFEDVVEGSFTVEVSDAFGRGGRGSGQIARPDETVTVRVRLTVTGIVRGRFLMPGGAPVPYGTVRLTASGRAIGQVTTQGSAEVGSFAFDYVPAGPIRLDAEDPATARTGLAVGTIESEDQELALDVRAQALGTVRGRVTGDGTPQPGALVAIVSGTYRVATAADSDGWYEVPGIPEGRIVVSASLDGGYLKATAAGTLTGEGSTLQLDIALRPSGEVRGTVVKAVGETPAPAAVTVSVGGAVGAHFTQHTTEDGRFDFTRVAAGPGTLKADALGSIDLAQAAVQVPAGGVVEVPMRLNGVGALRGAALASDGVTPTGGYLFLSGGTAHRWSFAVRLGPDGLFHLPEVLAGPVTASLRVDGGGLSLYGTATGTIQPEQETVLDVQVQASGTVTGVVVRAGSTGPAFGATVTLQHQRGTIYTQAQGDGRFTFRGVPLGSFTLAVHDEITTGRATVRNQQVGANSQTVDVGTIELDAVPPTLTVLEPADGSSRPPLGGMVAVDLADAQTGIDPSSFRVVYASGARQTASEFTFEGGQARGRLRTEWQVVGANVLRFEVQDLAGNLTQTLVAYTASGSTLQGFVRNHDGSPAAGAQVLLGSMSPAETDAAGAYDRGGLRAGSYFAWAVDPATGLTSARQWLAVFDGETRQRDFALPAFGWVNGIVRHADGSPAPDAVVSCCLPVRTVASGPGGAYSLGAFTLGTHDLTASEPSRGDRGATRVIVATAGQTVAADIRLNGVGTVTATVRNPNGSAVPGALVRASSSSTLGWVSLEQPTGPDGSRSWTQVLAGNITVLARDTVRDLAGQAAGVLSDNGELSVTVSLEPAATVTGTVYRAGGTAPASGIEVSISGAANRTVTTDLDGVYTIANVRLSTFQLVARDLTNGDLARGSGVVTVAASTVTADLTLTGVGQVRVLVRKAGGAPAAGADVIAWPAAEGPNFRRGTAAEDGSVSFTNVLAGSLRATAALPDGLGSGEATATLAPGQDLDVIVTLGATGTIRGRVLQPDGTTPAAGVTLSVPTTNNQLVYATSGADGGYEFAELPLSGGYLVKALVSGRTRAQSPYLTLSTAGQVVVHDLVLVGIGTVAGLVTDPAGNAAPGAEILLRVAPYATNFRTTAGPDGRYSVAEVPMGPFTVTASRLAQGQSVDRSAEITRHGEALTIDLQLLSSFVTLPHSLADGNELTWIVQTDGSVHGAKVVTSTERAARLTLFENGTPRTFAGGGTQAASEEAKRELVIRQTGLAGLTVTRKAFVPVTGYFIRYLDVLENPGSTPITVDVLLESQHTLNSHTPSVVDSASGDATPEPVDSWLLLDDADTQDVYEAVQAQFAPLGVVLSGPNGLRPSTVAWNPGSHTLSYRWDGVTVLPGQTVAFLHLMTAQADRARGRASAIRLAEGPPEALVGLSPEEAGAIRNFVVPASLASGLEPLPANDGVIHGTLLGGDGQTPVPGRTVFARSRSPHYGRSAGSRSPSQPDGSFEIYGTVTEGIKLVPRTEFDLTASVTEFGTQTATVPGALAQTGLRDLADVPGRTLLISSQASDAYSAAANAVDGRPSTYWKAAWPDSAEHNLTPFLEVVLPGDATIHEVRVRSSLVESLYRIRRARVQVKSAENEALFTADVDLDPDQGTAFLPVPMVAGARRVRVTSLADGTMPTIAELEILGEGPFGPSRHARQDLPFTGRGILEGRLRREDGSTIAGGQVKVPHAGNQHIRTPDADGLYRYPVVPPGSYIVTGEHPLGDHSVTVANVPVAADQKTTQDLVFAGLGRLAGATSSATGQAVNAAHRLEGPGLTRLLQSPATTYAFLDVPAGAYTLTSTDQRSQGAVSVPVTITAGATTTQDVTFPPIGSVVVTATVNGQPLLNNGPVYWTSASRTARTFAGYTNAGQLTILNVPGPTFIVEVQYPGYPKSFGEATATIPTEAAAVPVSVAVPGLGAVTGTVRSRNGAVQPNASVKILHATDDTTTFGTTTANGTGQFTVNNVPAGPIRLRSTLSLAYAGAQVMDEGEVAGALTAHGQTLTLDGLISRGTLTAANPAAFWEYTLPQGAEGEVQAIGYAHGSDPALADPRLEVYGPGGTLVAANEDRSGSDKNPRVQFTAAQTGTHLAVVKATGTGGYRLGSGYNGRAFRPYLGTTVTGHALREGAGTLAGAAVRLTAAQAGGLSVTASTTTAPDGSFQFTTVPSQATLTVELVENGLVLGRATGASGAAGTSVDLPVVRPGLGQVEVRTTYRGAPFGPVPVQLVSTNAFAFESLTTQSGTTGPDGRWVATPFAAGTVTAQATDPITGAPVEACGTLADGGALALELILSDGGDTVPPSAIANLIASAPSIGVVRLAWTAPGDDGGTGTAALYDLRYSTAPINAANFASATVAPAPTPAPAGTGQTFDLTGLAPNATYYLALKTRDEAYNWSGLSNVAQVGTAGLPTAGLKLWLKADAGVTLAGGSSYVSGWQDQSGQNNHATQGAAASQPLLVPGEVNGLPVLRFDGANDWLGFATRLTTIRTVFWVVRETPAAANGFRFLLGDASVNHFHSDATHRIWVAGSASASVLNGETRVNSALVNGTTTDRPTTLAVLSLVTTGPVTADSFSRSGLGRYWLGDLAELVIYDRLVGDAERSAVEAYLARKYGLYAPPLPAPVVVPSGGTLSAPTLVSLQAEPGAEVRYTLDGSEPQASSPLYTEPLSVNGRTTLKAKAFAPGWTASPTTTVTFLASSDFSPATVGGLKLWVRADAAVEGSAATRVGQWSDQSGQANHLTQGDVLKQPLVLPNAAAGLPALTFDGANDWLGFTTRLTTVRTVFWVARESAAAPAGYRFLMGDTTNGHFSSDNTHRIWSTSASTSVLNGQTRLNGTIVNGTTTNRPTGSLSLLSLVTTGPVTAASFASDRGNGRYWWGELAELAVYDTALSDPDRRAVEEYLAARYGITLP